MPGVAGRSGGHNIKRSDQKLGRPHHAQDDPRSIVDKPTASGPAEQPALVFPGGDKPLTMVRELWDSMRTSGFHEYYTDADWRGAIVLLYQLQQILKEQISLAERGKGAISPMKTAELRSIMGDLMVLESARRRLRIEVQRSQDSAPPEGNVSHLELARTLAS